MSRRTFGNFLSTIKEKFKRVNNKSREEDLLYSPTIGYYPSRNVKTAIERLKDISMISKGCCVFKVKYLGKRIVYDSRGAYVCANVIESLIKQKNKPRCLLYICSDGFRLVKEGKYCELLVYQTIDKVSFASSCRAYPNTVAFITLDKTSRSYVCHALKVLDADGERVSEAMRAAFQISHVVAAKERCEYCEKRKSCMPIGNHEYDYWNGLTAKKDEPTQVDKNFGTLRGLRNAVMKRRIRDRKAKSEFMEVDSLTEAEFE